MRKTLLLFTTMALALLFAAGTAWAAPLSPTVSTDPAPTPPAGVATNANIKATFAEAMKAKSINTDTFYLLPGNFTALKTTAPFKNPKRFCATGTPPVKVEAGCPAAITATVTLDATAKIATLDPTALLTPNTDYTVVVEGTNDGDNVAVKNTGGTPMAQDFLFHFKTA